MVNTIGISAKRVNDKTLDVISLKTLQKISKDTLNGAIVRFLNYSCALTLTQKYKLKSLAKTFKKFGHDLKFTNENTNIDQLLSQS